jgi:hypothetical protein
LVVPANSNSEGAGNNDAIDKVSLGREVVAVVTLMEACGCCALMGRRVDVDMEECTLGAVVVAAFGAVREAVADIGRGMDAVVMAVPECAC